MTILPHEEHEMYDIIQIGKQKIYRARFGQFGSVKQIMEPSRRPVLAEIPTGKVHYFITSTGRKIPNIPLLEDEVKKGIRKPD